MLPHGRRRTRHEGWRLQGIIVRGDLQLQLPVVRHVRVTWKRRGPGHVRATGTIVAQRVRLQHFVAISDCPVQRAVIAQRRRRRHGQVGVAVGDRWIVVAEYVVLQVWTAMRSGHWARARLIQSYGDPLEDVW